MLYEDIERQVLFVFLIWQENIRTLLEKRVLNIAIKR